MGNQVCAGATMQCSCGTAPASLVVLPINKVPAGGPPAATIMDNVPFLNIPPFGMCQSVANPAVVAATAAALGVLTPMPCVPVPAGPWTVDAPTVLIGDVPALKDSSKLMCSWGGVIEITNPGQVTGQIP